MPAVLLVSVEQVKVRMALSDDLSSDAVIESAISSAQFKLSSILETPFDRVTNKEDVFFIDSDLTEGLPNDFYRLRLSQSLLDEALTPTVTYGETLGSETSEFEAGKVRIDKKKGIVYVSTFYSDCYVNVVYTAGFESGSATPEWLTEAILATMPEVMNNTQITNRSKEVSEVIKGNQLHAAALLEPYMRGRAFHTYPIP